MAKVGLLLIDAFWGVQFRPCCYTFRMSRVTKYLFPILLNQATHTYTAQCGRCSHFWPSRFILQLVRLDWSNFCSIKVKTRSKKSPIFWNCRQKCVWKSGHKSEVIPHCAHLNFTNFNAFPINSKKGVESEKCWPQLSVISGNIFSTLFGLFWGSDWCLV